MENVKKRTLSTISKYINIYLLLSFIGWTWETIYMILLTGEFSDRGFLTLPFCPIYGTVLLSVYFLLGNITEKRGIMRYVDSDNAAAIMYLCFCFIFPTAAELLVGEFFLKVFDMRLWDYSAMSYNTKGHIALEISILWGALIFIFMNKIFNKIKRAVFMINDNLSLIISALLLLLISADMIILLVSAIV